jgi:hypothetical protein
MRTPEEIRSHIDVFNRYMALERENALTANDPDSAGQALRKMYDWRLRLEILHWVLMEPGQ